MLHEIRPDLGKFRLAAHWKTVTVDWVDGCVQPLSATKLSAAGFWSISGWTQAVESSLALV